MLMVMGTFLYGLGLTWIFILFFGLYGAAYGLVAAVGITVILKLALLRRYLPIRIWQPFIHSIKFYPELYRILTKTLQTK